MPAKSELPLETFHSTLDEVKTLLKGIDFMVINGGALYFYIEMLLAAGLEVLSTRLPTDLDIAVQTDLHTLMGHLERNGIPYVQETDPVELWGLKYSAPCVVLDIEGEKVNLLPETWIVKQDGSQCYLRFAEVKPFVFKRQEVSLLPLEEMRIIKEFQYRGRPKTDDLDLEAIAQLSQFVPGMFDLEVYLQLQQTMLS